MAGLEPYWNELLDAVRDDGTGNWLNVLAATGFQIHPHAKGLEFEIKYTPRSAAVGELGDYARMLLASEDLPQGVISPQWLVFGASTVEYWLLDGTEWSKRRKSGGTDVLKRKAHQVFRDPSTGTPLVQSTEDFVTDPERITVVLEDVGGSAGVVHKARAKGHYVDLATGIVFNLVESRCRVGDAEQIQLELEYGAHVYHATQEPAMESTPAELRAQLWNLHRLLNPRFDKAGLDTTVELKRDFVQTASAKQT
ncbi:hypothetical protein [Streptomyces alanosinicus]|uniref:Uncharacterized protein n=1 Tax=Streptomyces alanosinicus TaxID=68171 RepID=A0A918YKN3_9ACTN|nr:hypothetical protein [Streptomyces alanosinicus]GHE07296.1 hypothetical protein GCM10010339_51820 [Streptomyces alanosinicus]